MHAFFNYLIAILLYLFLLLEYLVKFVALHSFDSQCLILVNLCKIL